MSDQENSLVQNVEVTFKFRERKDQPKRDNVTLTFPALTAEGIKDALNKGGKTAELIIEVVTGVQSTYIRSFVDSDLEYNQEKLDELIAKGETSIEYIATKPRADRNVISKADLEAFAEVYVPVIVQATGKEQDRVEKGASVLVNRFAPVRGDFKALAILAESLEIFVKNVDDEVITEHGDALTYLTGKVEELQNAHISADAL